MSVFKYYLNTFSI